MSIGVVIHGATKAQRDKLSGILRFAAEQPDWTVSILDVSRNIHVQLDENARFDGLIRLMTTGNVLSRGVKGAQPPTVAIDFTHDLRTNVPNILIDNAAIGQNAAELLLKRGLRNFATVAYTEKGNTVHSKERIDGFAKRLAKAGFSVFKYLPRTRRENGCLYGSEPFRKWLLDLPKPCGIMAFSDRQSRDILDSCRLAQLSIPNQVSLVGVDNETDLCETTRPTLSSIQPDFEGSGYLAAQTLDRLLSGQKVAVTSSYGILRIVERESTYPTGAGGRIVATAMQRIQETASETTVSGLARKLRISTTLLNRSFNEILGHGPKEEIDRQRLATIKDLLRDKSLPISEIASRCHFSYQETLYLFFRRHTGLTPTQWRKQQKRRFT